ncbi:sigma-54-dependent Fis family transcriptional regulator [Geomicrobium sp. JCM 19038]|uniref:sigma-54 interaction domain-containing protein n=1 Tax=Geomicrobium sp. JCM 19038 TaxID=1460635 RepID=UPI00045F470C|nr:sigma 54-interacting transcriptional regulator [Geomicrobium sp. JCM 19038]GAK08024.1 nitrogenase (molybdenum-iron)-specific transcriptional regulator NifA [Geomicrobium sp. JCM 19038]
MKITTNGWVHQLMRKLGMKNEQLQKELSLYQTALEHSYEGIIVVDRDGYIISINETYASFINKVPGDVRGKHVTEVIENTRMHIVAKTGYPEVANVQEINGHQMIANRIPIVLDGEVVAVVGKIMFQDLDDLFKMNSQFQELIKQSSLFNPPHEQLKAKYAFQQIAGQDDKIVKTRKMAKKAAKTDTTILIEGESGTGKELFAHAIHRESKRANGPFVRLHCAAIPESLFESELFGYKEGSFTGAKQSGKVGKIALAHRGTLFLDEVSEMPLAMQVKLLRVLQEKEIEPIGGVAPEAVDVRVIAATNRPLEALVKKGSFRADLYYRLYVMPLRIPPLRERLEDFGTLAHSLLRELEREMGIDVAGLTTQAEEKLKKHAWPGNIRELRNVLERAMIRKEDEWIESLDVDFSLMMDESTASDETLQETIERIECERIKEALKHEDGDAQRAAKRLGIGKSSFYAKRSKYNIP